MFVCNISDRLAFHIIVESYQVTKWPAVRGRYQTKELQEMKSRASQGIKRTNIPSDAVRAELQQERKQVS